MPELKNRQHELFCREYVAAKFNGSEAYRRAYPKVKSEKVARTNAARLLSDPDVSARIAELSTPMLANAGVTGQRVIDELALIAFHRANVMYRHDGSLKSPCEWDEATNAAVAGVESEEEFAAEGEEQEPQGHGGTLKRNRGGVTATRTNKVKRFDKVRALELLGKHFGLWKEDAPHPDRKQFDLSKLTDVQKAQLLAALRVVLGATAPGGAPIAPGGS